MSGGGQTPAGNTTNTQTPPAYMYPYIGTALGRAGNLLQGPGPQYYPGQQVAGFSDPQTAAFGGIQDLATNPGLSGAQGYNNSLLTGNFTGPQANLAAMGQGGATNPYLDAMFKQAAGATQGQLESEFGGAGRNVDAAAPLQAQTDTNLATSLYGNAYAQNQANALSANALLTNAQGGAVNNAQNLDTTKLGLLGAESGVGSQVQNLAQQQIDANQAKYNYYQQLPYNQLQQYEGQLGALQPGMQQSSPYFTNPLGNALGTGMMGLGAYGAGSQAGLWGGSKGAANVAGSDAAAGAIM